MTSAEEQLPRKLTAILQVDVVGYSRLMGQDESGTLRRLRNHQNKLINPTIKAFHGRVVKLMGDGILIWSTSWKVCTRQVYRFFLLHSLYQ